MQETPSNLSFSINKNSLSHTQQALLLIVSFLIVSFGQPAWSWWCGVLAGIIGYALFWRVLLCHPSAKSRFWISTAWFGSTQLVQLSWLLTHPYSYIYAVYLFFPFIWGLQFGLLGTLITKEKIKKIRWVIAIASLWTLLEWSRLFFLNGYTWNPIGLALTTSIYPLQMASLWGIYGLSFWVILVNLLALQFWFFNFKPFQATLWIGAALIPYIYGAVHLEIHKKEMAKSSEQKAPFTAVLVQTAFPIEEMLPEWGTKNIVDYVTGEWRQILNITKKHHGQHIDLIALPEFTVPYGTYSPVYPLITVQKTFIELFGLESIKFLPPLESPWAFLRATSQGASWFVNNAFWLQGMANIFHSSVIAGLEDAEDIAPGIREYYSAAQYFRPLYSKNHAQDENISLVDRYAKRVLVPMGEHIPWTFLKDLAAQYGVTGSFTPGKEAKIFNHHKIPFGVSICYEETFGHMMRENKQLGAHLLVNLTSDVWYPNSRLPQQHFDHARLRAVENGIPLVRACNTGVTGGIDSLGRIISVLGETSEQKEWLADSLKVEVPLYTYHTLYTRFGDNLILGFSAIFLVINMCFSLKRPKY